MTIKEFAGICRCSTQTLRYYDRIGLLKPQRVDDWTGYRHYDAAQAIDFVKIKNLQAADFTIGEIKALLTQPDEQVYQAFSQKIAQQEQKLERIREIQQSYLREKTDMEKIIESLSSFIIGQFRDFEGLREFGLSPEDGPRLAAQMQDYLENQARQHVRYSQELTLTVDDQVVHGAENIADAIAGLEGGELPKTVLLGDETVSQEEDFDPSQYHTLWAARGWEHVYEFLEDIPRPEAGGEYCLLFYLKEERCPTEFSFPLFMLGTMILKKGMVKATMSCTVEKSADGVNRFALLRKK